MPDLRTVYVNGKFLPEDQAMISVFDRGFVFGDAVYEVATVLDGKLVDNASHLARLERSLEELDMPAPLALSDIPAIQHELVARNSVEQGLVYLQISRGAADREFEFPAYAQPSLVMYTQAKDLLTAPKITKGLQVITLEDIRWKRRDIKTVNLLAPVLAKQAAIEAGANDAWMVEDGYVTEGSSNNAFIVTQHNQIITRQLGHEILHGITRKAVMSLAQSDGLDVVERAFTPQEAYDAKEAFITSASAFVMPVVRIDDYDIGDGKPGPLTQKLRARYIAFARETLS